MKPFRQTWTAIRALVIFTIVLGVAYPLAITGISQLALNDHANGQPVTSNGQVVGSAIIGQSFTDADGGRPAAVVPVAAVRGWRWVRRWRFQWL